MYIYDLAVLRSNLMHRYKAPVTATSVSAFRGKSGILMVETSDGSGGSVGLWDGIKMHETTDSSDHTNAVRKAYLWTPTGKCLKLVCLHYFKRHGLW